MVFLPQVQLPIVQPFLVAHDLHDFGQSFAKVREIALNRVQSINIILQPTYCSVAYSRALGHDLKDVNMFVDLLYISLCKLIVEIFHYYLRTASR